MSPLRIEIVKPETETSTPFGVLKPGEPIGFFPHYPPEGHTQRIIFECDADDMSSVICKSDEGVYVKQGTLKEEHAGVERIATLSNGASHDLSIITGKSRQEVTVRFTHVERG